MTIIISFLNYLKRIKYNNAYKSALRKGKPLDKHRI